VRVGPGVRGEELLTLQTGDIFGLAKYVKHEKQCENRFLLKAPDTWEHIVVVILVVGPISTAAMRAYCTLNP
jgi:hypothetical protein